MIDRAKIEDGIWPLVEAVNLSGFATVSSCEGHPDRKMRASVVFLATNDEAQRIHLSVRQIESQLLCSWELFARFIYPNDEWVLVWNLQSLGVKDRLASESDSEIWEREADSAKTDVVRLAGLFLDTINPH